ncbi:hypothetical protein HN419_04680 [Candidatus Woesearchaeota archaeon]|nr:hypothetical protein [Candidatus Woesearchaeota archaeon]MBT3537828.1 hypothetical protein [Candidatus Woesearchaeota archaeon]MBT4697959.1 hypothetical protein [Candidatus Woesearchaeota archaeon]MBT7105497.1 hypothetical protein [Candidatus Woesearchaeota archaeon]MBT7931687.1 hypothetical protein [Candidatus Woesearchaeota archaeon]
MLSLSSYALDCQYTEEITVIQSKEMLSILNKDKIGGDTLVISDFTEGNRSTFSVYNPNRYNVTAFFSYVVEGNTAGKREFALRIEAESYSMMKEVCFDGVQFGNCTIVPESVEYYVARPSVMFPKVLEVPVNKTVCKTCSNKECLSDHSPCNPLYDDSRCGSGICNIAGFCDHQKVVECSNGTINCNDILCLEPASKNVSESYTCSWECKSDRYNNETCLDSTDTLDRKQEVKLKNRVTLAVMSVIICSFCIWFFCFYRRRKEECKLENAISKLKGLEKNIENIHKKINKYTKKEKYLRNKIKDLEHNAKKAKGHARELFEKEINRLTKECDDYRRLRNNASKEISEAEETIKIAKGKSREAYIIKQTKKYELLYGGGSTEVYYDHHSDYLMIEFKNGNKYFLHRHIYYKKLGLKKGYEIHHIDNDHLNNELWNLIELPKEKHNKKYRVFRHSKLDRGDWELGIKELKRQLNMKDKDFHEYIKEHMKDK